MSVGELSFAFNVRVGELGFAFNVRAGKLDSSRASLSRKIFRKHARTEMFVSPALSTRALLHIFHRDGPDSSHYSLLGLSSPCFGWVVWNARYYQLHSCLSRFCGLQRLKHSENWPQNTLSVPLPPVLCSPWHLACTTPRLSSALRAPPLCRCVVHTKRQGCVLLGE